MSIFRSACSQHAPVLAVLGLLLISPLLGTPARAEEEESACSEAQTTIEIGECVSKAYEEADAKLNAVWKEVMASFKKVDYMPAKDLKDWKDTMLGAQRAWVAFKEKDCDAVGYEWFGGTGRSNAVIYCLLAHTTARTEDLKSRFLDR